MDPKIKISGVFDRAASRYGEGGANFFNIFGKKLVDFAQIKPQTNVLDIATGKGAILKPASLKAGHVVGIDISQEMVKAVKAEGYDARVMDAENLEFNDGQFDYVMCGFGLFFFPNKERALNEFKRVLKHKGKLCLSIWGDDSELDVWLREETQKMGKKHVAPPLNKSELRDLLEHHFVNVKIVDVTEIITYKSKDEWWESLWTHATRSILEELTEQELKQFRENAFKKIDSMEKGLEEPFHVHFAIAERL